MKHAYFPRLILFLCVSLLFILPVYIFAHAHHLSWRYDSDYDSVQSFWEYATDYTRDHHQFPKLMPYAGVEMPARADPSFPLYNPLLLVPFLFFGFADGLWFVLVLLTFLNGISMYFFLSSLKISSKLSIWGSLLYAGSGAFVARIAAGHVIYFATYFLWPILWWATLKAHPSRRLNVFLSVVITLFFITGDIYGVMYAILFMSIIFIYLVGTRKRSFRSLLTQYLLVMGGTFICSLPKLYFMYTDRALVQNLIRFYPATFGQGSIHLLFTPLPFIIPWNVSFYDRPFFQRHLGFYFNWYEYYAFISPLPFIFLLWIIRVKHRLLSILGILVIISLLFVTQKYPYSPFYWLLHNNSLASFIRVPQRMYLPLTSILIGLLTLCAQAAFQSHLTSRIRLGLIAVLLGSLVWTFLTNITTLPMALESPRIREEQLVKNLRRSDTGNYFVLNLLCCTQTFLVHEKIPILNFYAGSQSKKTPSFIEPKTGMFTKELLHTVRPKYILAPSDQTFVDFDYQIVITQPVGNVWRTNQITIVPIIR